MKELNKNLNGVERKHNLIKILAGILVMLVLISWGVNATNCSANLIVYVKGVDESPVTGASVILYNSSWAVMDTKNTNQSGYVNFTALVNMTYHPEFDTNIILST